MAEDKDILESLAQVSPTAPTADDAASDKAGAAAQQSQIQSAGLGADAAIPSTKPTPSLPNLSTAPVTEPKNRPGSFGWHFMNNVSAALTDPATAAALKEPGALMKAFTLGGVQAVGQATPHEERPAAPQSADWNAARSNKDASQPSKPAPGQRVPFGQPVMALLGDMAGPERGLAGFAKANTTREAQEQKDRVLMATANAQMLHEQALTHKMGEDAIAASAAGGRDALNVLLNAEEPATPKAEGKTSDDLNQMIKNKEIDPSKDTVFLTGRVLTGKDSNGQPLYRSTYSIVTPAGPVMLDEAHAKFMSDNLHKDFKAGTAMSAAQFNYQYQQATNARITRRAFDVKDAQDQKVIDEAQNTKEAKGIFTNATVLNAIANNSTPARDKTPDQFARVKAFDAIVTNPDYANMVKDGRLPANFSEAYIKAAGGEAEWKNLRDEYNKARAKNQDTVDTMVADYTAHPDKISGHTPAVIAAADSVVKDPNASAQQKADALKLKSQALATQAFETSLQGEREISKDEAKIKAQQRASAAANPKGLTGDAFIKSLPPGRANTLRAFSNGTLVLNPSALERTDKGQAYLDDIYSAYPDLDSSKAPAYAKLRQSFTSGKEAAGINNANTAIHHLNRMDINLSKATAGYTGSVEQFLGANEAGRAVADDAMAISGELGKLYTGGVVTEGEKDAWEEKLNPKGFGMTVGKLKTNVKEFTKLLGGKLEAFQDQWDDGVPSKLIPAPKAVASQESVETYKRLTGEDMKVHLIQPTSKEAGANDINISKQYPTASGVVQGSDGKWYAHDIKNKILGETTAPAGAQ